MDHDRKKRPRTSEGDHQEGRSKHFSDKKKHPKRQLESVNDNIIDLGSTSYISPDQNPDVAAPSVFDFPWLKEGVVSKTEEWKFEDAFLSQLGETTSTTITTATGIEFSFPGQGLYQTPVEAMLDFPEEKFDRGNEWSMLEDYDNGLEKESLDCVWSSLLNQPLRQHN
ncbi:hypothetical protein TorRG33x02_238280 [Trema orientale]|uniref:Uncharacterized protein n=1 Tax=Trema orientale TaxID=63057 RepID=A0A2P5DY57_TREOI|nr:hypothetical protein TorRG33x02_238280 [Trema orientale]